MASPLPIHPRFGQHALLVTTAAIPLTGWALHALELYRSAAATRRDLAAAQHELLAAQRDLAAAQRDPLTGLLRRDVYTAAARKLLVHRGDRTLLVLIDIDHFKQINDTLGHAAGDAVLIATAARLTDWAGPDAAVGRLGGDELIAVLHTEFDHRDARLAQLQQMLTAPVTTDDGQTINVAVSIGGAAPDTVGSQDLFTLQRAADSAMYDTKHTGRPLLATARHTTVPSVNGRRAGRPGTAEWGRAA